MTSSDAYTPTTTQDDSLFQGFITLFRTQRAVPAEMPLPDRGGTVGDGWGELYKDNIIIARGLTPDKSLRVMWIQHMSSPVSFAEQDKYNFSEDGTTLTRVYVMLRSEYLEGYDEFKEPPAVPDLLISTEDDVEVPFAGFGYCYTGEKVDRIGTDPDSIFVAITRTWLKKITVTKFHDDELDSDITQTREIIGADTGSASSSAGTTVRIDPGNRFIDYKVTEDVTGFSEKLQLRSLMADVPYKFPMLMTSAAIVGAAAYAASSSAAAAYQESFYFSFNLIEPTVGPYEARILRFLVADPDTLRTAYPIQKFVTRREIIGTCRAWAIGSDKGNSVSARAEEREVPPCIHDDIEIINADTLSIGQSTDSLSATPNFKKLTDLAVMNVGYETTKTRYGLYLVQITQLNATGVYSGVTVPFPANGDDPTGTTGAGDIVSGIIAPTITSAAMSADNKTLVGVASKNSVMTVKLGADPYGVTQADAEGHFTVPISPIPRDAVDFSVRAQRSGVYSSIRKVTSYDLAPLAPSATISGTLDYINGTTEPGATITIYVNLGEQVETLTIPDKRNQTIAIQFLTTDPFTFGTSIITVTSALLASSPLLVPFEFEANHGNTGPGGYDGTAGVAAIALNANSEFSEFFVAIPRPDPDTILTLAIRTKTPAANDPDLDLTASDGDPDDGGSVGLTSTSPVTLFNGNDDVSVDEAATSYIGVKSSLYPSGEKKYFSLPVGGDSSDIATAARLALKNSVVINKYKVEGSGSDIILKTRAPYKPTDPFLNIDFYTLNYTGTTVEPFSVDTQGAGISFTTVANDQGDWFIAIDPPFHDGDKVLVYASDDGGTSPATSVEADAAPPTLTSAAFPGGDYNTISGNATAASIVIATYKDVEKGRATTSGGGTYAINFPVNYIRGETFTVTAVIDGSENIRSASLYVDAAIVDLEIPTLEENPLYPGNINRYAGLAPNDVFGGGYAQIVARLMPYTPGDPETVETPFPSTGNFSIQLPGRNGEEWHVFGRYALGDSDPLIIILPKEEALFAPIYFHYQGSIAYTGGFPNQKWPPESGYPASNTIILSANALRANDTALNIVIDNATSTGIIAGAAGSENTVAGGGANKQVETATTAGTVTSSTGNAKVTIKSNLITGAGGTGLVLTFPVFAGDNAHIVAARAITKLNSTAAVTTYYNAGSSGALNQIAIVNPYPGNCDIEISFPPSATVPVIYSPANQAMYDLYPTGYFTGSPGPDVPPYFEVKVTLPDGRFKTNTFLRSTHKPYAP